jgi:hypothetical protein
MKCDEVEIRLIDYLEGNLDDITCRDIEKHLETCNSCLDALKESQDVLKLMSDSTMEKPDESMRIGFYHMLHKEIKQNSKKAGDSFIVIPGSHWITRNMISVAAGIAILICGTFLGIFIKSEISGSGRSEEISKLKSEVNALKKTVFYSMLGQESSSGRIQAVNYIDGIPSPDQPVINVLVKTLNSDKNVNVRMAAAYALSRFADQRAVCDSLVKSLSLQNDPILQVTLINILVEHKVKSAIGPMENIINNKSTLKEVKSVAENGVMTLI